MPQTATIPVTDLPTGDTVVTLPPTNAPYESAQVKVNRSGTGGTNPWLNSLTTSDSLTVKWEWSPDGNTWHVLSTDTLPGGSTVVKGVTVPQWNVLGVGIGVTFPAGTVFRVTMTPSTPVTFSGSALYQ